MPHNRYFLDSPLNEGNTVVLYGEEAHHLSHVMRKNEGDDVELINGKHQLALATIVHIEKKKVSLELNSVIEKSPPKTLILCQAIARLNRLETIVEKGTELGMTSLWLFPGQLSEKKDLSPTQLERLRSISIAAIKQSGRLGLPNFVFSPPLAQWKRLESTAYFGDLSPNATPLLTALKEDSPDSILFFVGPEAGFTPYEKDALCHLQVKGVRLHPNILRTDTASLTALSIISHFFMTLSLPF